MDDEARRALMSRFRGKNSRPEVLVRQRLHAEGLRFRLHRRDLPGTPDIVMVGRRTVVFVHGCFWHHHTGCPVARIPASRPDFWREKFRRNKRKDRASREALETLGWRVKEIWECEALDPTKLEVAIRDLIPRTAARKRSAKTRSRLKVRTS
ncbi:MULTISPECIES: DNA mismatch endonuclease Vsr [Bradyrhizobium]|uniref:very short patch repair endonuclease n=1 Tax=Bradyrhizobium TaxID=374 RepID=UPI0009B9413A|nr:MULTISPECIES: DNA mismatch endonuclease Vsr [Bradyrhizobium]